MNEEDFGFTFEDEINQELIQHSENQHKADLETIEKIVLPLFNSLLKNPEKSTINWPNRKEILEKKVAELLTVTRKYK